MTDAPAPPLPAAARPRRGLVGVAAAVFAGTVALGGLAGAIAAWMSPAPPAAGDAGATVAGQPALRGAIETFRLHAAPRELPAVTFRDADDQPVTLADFRGRVVLLNLWATWCAPCVEEMPALSRLQAALGGEGFTVLALSIDRQGRRIVDPFLARLALDRLPVYLDPSGGVARALGVPGLPTTLLIDRDGRELGRIAGTAAWDGEAAANLVRFAASLPSMAPPGGRPLPPAVVPGAAPAAPAPAAPAPAPAAPRDAAPPDDRIPDVPDANRADAAPPATLL